MAKNNKRNEVLETYRAIFERLKEQLKNRAKNRMPDLPCEDKKNDPFTSYLKALSERSNTEFTASFDQLCHHYMCAPYQVNRRINAAMKYREIGKDKISYKGTYQEFQETWMISTSLILKGGYDSLDIHDSIISAAAIWILDAITANGKIKELYPLLEDAYEYDHKKMFPLIHPSYDIELIFAMANLIKHRNDDLYQSDGFTHNWTDPWVTSSPRSVPESKKRACFEAVLGLIDEEEKKRVAAEYEQKVWEFYDITFSIDRCIQKKGVFLNQTVEEADKRLTQAYNNNISKMNSRSIKVQAPFMLAPTNITKEHFQESINDLEKEKAKAQREYSKFLSLTMADLSGMAYVEEREKHAEMWKAYVPKELLERLVHFSVKDPFESCFALLYLIDINSHIPWLYFGSVAVFYTIIDQLPYNNTQYFAEDLLNANIDKAEENVSAVYEIKYPSKFRFENSTDSHADPIQRVYCENLAQRIYAQSLMLIPRNARKIPHFNVLTDDADLDQLKEICHLLLLMTVSQYDRDDEISRNKLQKQIVRIEEWLQDELSSQRITDDEAKEYKRQIKSIERGYREAADKNAKLENEKKSLLIEIEEMRRELADLRELAYHWQHEAIETEEEQKIEFPYTIRKKIVCFGGHDSWLKVMKTRLNNIRFITPGMLPNTNLIRSADEVWIQTNCLSHSDYYKIINTVRENNIQIRYFSYDSAEKCASQLAMSDSDSVN